ncbi:hypothetical protein BN940_03646 [Castellaniella defragrans 65Phen]|uniref:Uncharacterized protein n=1 Tax=Castellaniella defragrans (strain DSM 12143 / CCUG 39792 / 65Phen) TaxID=1437824 RepID=W8WUI3_CASD6|nr:hypothetical protein BN940_03646 [Castellaniella defragrans 65Phen]
MKFMEDHISGPGRMKINRQAPPAGNFSAITLDRESTEF